ncbi:sensor histidine kinase [Streptomyces sp. NPDC015232]|uniref:sensor histidine kinase n=1 Tax=unclassified Streptomyces TaxID=2593676 RepID=UPI0036F74D6B
MKPSSFALRPPRPALVTALTAALVVCAAAAWLQHADRLAGPLAPEGPARFATDRIGPQIELLNGPGWVIGAVCVAAACWISAPGYAPGVRARTTVAAGTAAGVLFFAQVRWIAHYDSFQPYDTADATLSWALTFIAPTTALLTGMAAWTALGSGAPRLPFRSRLVLTATLTSAVLLGLAVYLLRQVQYQWGNIDTVYWVALTTGAPAVGVLTGLLTHVTADRSLRPVEAIRRRLAHITSHSLDQRVPVPATDDAIARLARTTNDTLDRLEQASVRQRRFVGDAAHELRSPLAAVRAQLESALRHPEGLDWPSVVRESVTDVIRLQVLADDLLLLAEMDGSPHTTPAAKDVDVSSLAEDLIREHQHLPGTEDLELTSEAPPEALVRGNAVQLERLLRNLLTNACRYAHRRVTVRSWIDGTTLVTEVTDDGPGIPAVDRERVFERFARLDEARARSDGGAGLGLPIAREIAARHGGTLVVADSDRGARFVVRLPLSTRRPSSPSAQHV